MDAGSVPRKTCEASTGESFGLSERRPCQVRSLSSPSLQLLEGFVGLTMPDTRHCQVWVEKDTFLVMSVVQTRPSA